MVNARLLKVIYEELKDDYCSIRYLADKTPFSKNHIYNMVRILKAMGFVEERYSDTHANVRVYKLKIAICDFARFLELYTEKL